jgi:hypothetical protein
VDYLPLTFLIYGFICYFEFTSLRSKNSEGNQAFMNLAPPPPFRTSAYGYLFSHILPSLCAAGTGFVNNSQQVVLWDYIHYF